MDTGKGYFVDTEMKPEEVTPLSLQPLRHKYPDYGGVFHVGQNLELNGSKFRVLTITKKTMTLRLLPK
jgi:hypothetical protein